MYVLFGDVDPFLLSTPLSSMGFFHHHVQGKDWKWNLGLQPSGRGREEVSYCLPNFHHPEGGKPLVSLGCWDADDLELMKLGRTYLELARKLISFGGMCWV